MRRPRYISPLRADHVGTAPDSKGTYTTELLAGSDNLLLHFKHKTKAKSRYLKGKRERRKQRKALENANKSKPAKKRDEELESDNETEEEMAEENSGVAIMTVPEEEDIEMREVLDSKEREERKARKEKRPKKKRKTEAVDEQEEDISRPVMEDAIDPKESDIRVETTQKPTQSDSTVPIPSFPMPVQPPPASRAQLALQGMDSAMLEAEIIDPGLTDDVKDQNGVSSCLSGRMLKRLDELGITELFAGEFNWPRYSSKFNEHIYSANDITPFPTSKGGRTKGTLSAV